MLERDSLVIMDFDGVLADSKQFYFQFHKVLAPKYGLDPSMEAFTEMLRKDLLISLGESGLSKESVERYVAEFEHVSQPYLGEIQLFPFASKFVKSVQPLAIVSHNQSAVVRQVLANNNVIADVVLGSDDHPEKAVKIIQVMRKYEAEKGWFVGDAPSDIIAAKKAGVKSVAVTWGYFSEEELAACSPDVLVEDPLRLALVLGVSR